MAAFRSTRSIVFGLVMMTAIVASGCLQQSVNPLFVLEDSSFDERLLGSWTCGAETWTFAREVDNDLPAKPFYRIQIEADGGKSVLGAMLGRVGNDDFLNFLPLDDDPRGTPATDFAGRHSVGVYTFGRMSLDGGQLRLAMLGTEWLEQAYRAGLLSIGVNQRWMLASENDLNVILTAAPADLQRFARIYGRDDTVFSERIVLVRNGSGTAPDAAGQCYSNR